MAALPGIDALLAALRHAQIPVGPEVYARLHHVMCLSPRLRGDGPERETAVREEKTADALRSVLRALLVKLPEQAVVFDRVFDDWHAEVRAKLDPSRDPPLPPPVPIRTKEEVPPQRIDYAFLGSAAFLLALIVYALWPSQEPAGKTAVVTPQAPSALEPAFHRLSPDEIRQRAFRTAMPTVTVLPPAQRFDGAWELALGLGTLMLTGALAVAAWRRKLPEARPEPRLPGPPRVFLRTARPAFTLLDRQAQQALVWGIDRFISEESTRRLDLAATVRATARDVGIITPRYLRARFHRELWLWLDESADDPALARLADEIAALLPAHGLAVERATFRGDPGRLIDASGKAFAPREVEERRDAALVVVLTDGRLLLRAQEADDTRLRSAAVLRGLSHWPHLWFVDPPGGTGRFGALLAQHGIACLHPSELPARLSGMSATSLPPLSEPGDLRAWAAACALAPSPVDEASAWDLQRALRLAVSPWDYQAMRARAPGPEGRLEWSSEDRAELVNWLSACEGPGEGRLLDRALAFWQHVYAEWAQARAAAGGVEWPETPAARYLAMEQALLALWHDPARAVPTLDALRSAALNVALREHLSRLTARDQPQAGCIALPWAWTERSGLEQAMLARLGFGGREPASGQLRQPSRFWFAVGLGAALGLGAVGVAATRWQAAGDGPPQVQHLGEATNLRQDEPKRVEGGKWRVTAQSLRDIEVREVAAESRVDVTWNLTEQTCVEMLGQVGLRRGAEIWRCGSTGTPVLRDGDQPLAIAVIDAEPDAGVRDFALRLLDAGTVQQAVLLRPSGLTAMDYVDFLPWGEGMPDRRTLVFSYRPGTLTVGQSTGAVAYAVSPGSWTSLAAALDFKGERPASQVWPTLTVLAGDAAAVPIRGLPQSCRPAEYDGANGMKMIRLCAGSFRMGSPESEQGRDSDEGPQHNVTLSAFDMGKFEVTNWQFRAAFPHRTEVPEDDKPVTDVSWNDAKAYCEKFEYSLPTEAQWEYAARAPEPDKPGGRWSFGDDEARLGDYAWYDKNAGNKAHPVGTRQPNRWGLHDMHGNVWEWVADWHDKYSESDQTDPVGPATGSYRVLRGGAFIDPAVDLRSAFRGWFRPVNRNQFIGFRCALGPRRQP